jgi:hypothetical protein
MNNATVDKIKQEWLQSGKMQTTTLATANQNVTGLIKRLANGIRELERLATASRDKLAPELDQIHRSRQMQRAYGAAGVGKRH